MLDAARTIKPDIIVLMHGGPIAEPDDVQYILDRTHHIAGFYGASSLERLPVEIALTESTKRFKDVNLASQ
jgi:predicted TIM-barrel enzyme